MLNRLIALFKSFRDHDVRYVVIGGVAAVVHGVPRATFDLDILIEATESNASRLLEAFLAAGLGTAALTSPADVLAHAVTIFRDRVRVDVQTRTPGIAFLDAWERSIEKQFRGHSFRVLCRDDLIRSKRAAGRPVDLEDVRILESLDRPDRG